MFWKLSPCWSHHCKYFLSNLYHSRTGVPQETGWESRSSIRHISVSVFAPSDLLWVLPTSQAQLKGGGTEESRCCRIQGSDSWAERDTKETWVWGRDNDDN